MNRTLHRRSTHRVALALAAVALALGGAACDDSAGQSTPANDTISTAVQPGSAEINSFVVPSSVACNGQTSAKVTVQYEVSGASSQQLLVDGRQIPGVTAPSGSVEAEVHCDDLPHTFVLHALDREGRPTSQQVLLKTVL